MNELSDWISENLIKTSEKRYGWWKTLCLLPILYNPLSLVILAITMSLLTDREEDVNHD